MESGSHGAATGLANRESNSVARTETFSKRKSQTWGPTPVIPTPGRWRQEEARFKASQGHTRPYFKKSSDGNN